MSALSLLRDLFAYQAWANGELLEKLASLDVRVHDKERHAAIRLVNHCHVVSRIFSAHLLGASHGYSADNTEETPALGELRTAVTATDRWYLDYLETFSSQLLSEPVAFVFTDGDKALMSRQEILTHVVLHGSYHRGEVGRILAQIPTHPAMGYVRRPSPPGRAFSPAADAARAARRLTGRRFFRFAMPARPGLSSRYPVFFKCELSAHVRRFAQDVQRCAHPIAFAFACSSSCWTR